MSERLTIGYRCRIKSDSSWKDWGYADRECILYERSGQDFSVIMLKEGVNVPLERKDGVVVDGCAWLTEHEDLELVDKKIDANIRFLDWYDSVKDRECPDCGHLAWSEETQKHTLLQVKNKRMDYLEWICPEPNCGCVMG